MKYTTTTRLLHVEGRLWCGSRSKWERELGDASKPETLADAKRLALDFESVETASVTTITRKIDESIRHKRLLP